MKTWATEKALTSIYRDLSECVSCFIDIIFSSYFRSAYLSQTSSLPLIIYQEHFVRDRQIHHLSHSTVVALKRLVKDSLNPRRIQLLLSVESVQPINFLLNIGTRETRQFDYNEKQQQNLQLSIHKSTTVPAQNNAVYKTLDSLD